MLRERLPLRSCQLLRYNICRQISAERALMKILRSHYARRTPVTPSSAHEHIKILPPAQNRLLCRYEAFGRYSVVCRHYATPRTTAGAIWMR